MKLDALALALAIAVCPVVSMAHEAQVPAEAAKPDQWAAWGGTVAGSAANTIAGIASCAAGGC